MIHELNQPIDSFEEDLLAPVNNTIKLAIVIVYRPGDLLYMYEWNTNGTGRTGRYIKYKVISVSRTPLAHYGNVNRLEINHNV